MTKVRAVLIDLNNNNHIICEIGQPVDPACQYAVEGKYVMEHRLKAINEALTELRDRGFFDKRVRAIALTENDEEPKP